MKYSDRKNRQRLYILYTSYAHYVGGSILAVPIYILWNGKQAPVQRQLQLR